MMCFFHRLTLGFCLLLMNNCELLNALLNAPSSVYSFVGQGFLQVSGNDPVFPKSSENILKPFPLFTW